MTSAIAKSGTKDFMGKLTGDQKARSLAGVGFYSGFIVADKITVESRRAEAGRALDKRRHGRL